jgi:SAM-dependent methyltransferase
MHSGALQDRWQTTPAGGYMDARIGNLILTLAEPRPGERLLDVGCGGGGHLDLFRRPGCDLTGIDPSPLMLDEARQRLGRRAELHQGRTEDLPFPDNVFDLVTLITALEFADEPSRVLAEAVRVSRGRVLVGIMNRWSLIGLQGRLPSLFAAPPDAKLHSLHLTRLCAMIRSMLPGVSLSWGSVLFLPWKRYPSGAGVEERLPVMRNPFGAFIGLAFPVKFTLQTIQTVIREPEPIGPNGRTPVPGVVRGANRVLHPASLGAGRERRASGAP